MKNFHKAIGVMDSGVGGLSVVAQIQKFLPNEDILYFGDSINCPYGLQKQSKVLMYSKKMINFFLQNNVKAVVIACNTISTQIDNFLDCPIPIVEIITPTAKLIAKKNISKVGILATPFTVHTKCYGKLITFFNPNTYIFERGSQNLATLIESASFDKATIDAEIIKSLKPLIEKEIKDIVLGCTHYPIVEDRFKELYPMVNFLNPAKAEIMSLKTLLENKELLNPKKEQGDFIYCTSGYGELALKTIKALKLKSPAIIKQRQIL